MNTNGTKYTDAELTQMEADVNQAGLDIGRLGVEGCFERNAIMNPVQRARLDEANDTLDKWFKRFNP